MYSSQGKEIIEYYLKELDDEGITHVPRWTPSSCSLPPPRPTSLSTSPPDLPKLAVTPAVFIPLPANAKDSTSQDAKQDSSALQADSLNEILAGTPEGLFPEMIQKWIPVLVIFLLLFYRSENLVWLNYLIVGFCVADKLDADYIKRYLGDLTPLQESCLIRLRKWLQETHKGKVVYCFSSSIFCHYKGHLQMHTTQKVKFLQILSHILVCYFSQLPATFYMLIWVTVLPFAMISKLTVTLAVL